MNIVGLGLIGVAVLWVESHIFFLWMFAEIFPFLVSFCLLRVDPSLVGSAVDDVSRVPGPEQTWPVMVEDNCNCVCIVVIRAFR